MSDIRTDFNLGPSRWIRPTLIKPPVASGDNLATRNQSPDPLSSGDLRRLEPGSIPAASTNFTTKIK